MSAFFRLFHPSSTLKITFYYKKLLTIHMHGMIDMGCLEIARLQLHRSIRLIGVGNLKWIFDHWPRGRIMLL
jgi:hypothetical protein